jgi:hypothetical protein
MSTSYQPAVEVTSPGKRQPPGDSSGPGAKHAKARRNTSAEGDRFSALFPIAARILFHPGSVLVATVIAAMLMAPVSIHYAMSIVLLGLTCISVGWERRFLDALLFTPNLVAARFALMGGVIGCSYMASGMSEKYSPSLLAVQAAMMYWLVVSSLMNKMCLGNVPGIRMPWTNPRFNAECLRPLSVVAFAILSLELARQLIGVVTGGLDRGMYGDEAARQAFGIWTYFSIFPRLTGTSLFLAPVIWRVGRAPLKAVLVIMVGLLLIIGFSTGSRGLFLAPILYLFVGTYFFVPIRRFPLEAAVATVILFIFVPLVLVMATYRSSQEFRQTAGWQVGERVRGFTRTATEAKSELDEQATARQDRYQFGVQMIGTSDTIVYEKTPSEIPFVGFENFDRIMYVWIPKFFMRDKPYLQDGNDIVVGYTGVFFKRSASTISLLADLYRRFGIPGFLFGVPVAALITALFTRWVYRVMLFRDAVLGIVMLQLILSPFQSGDLWSTLLGSSFEWLYAIPKHLVLIFVLVLGARLVTGVHVRRGILAYPERI